MRNYYIFISLLGVVIIAGLIIGFMTTGNPEDLKNKSFDNQTISAFTNIKYSVTTYYQTNSKLPASILDLKLPPESIKNQKTKIDYAYSIESPTSYKLCTQFFTNSEDSKTNYNYPIYTSEDMKYKKGNDCITLNVSEASRVINKTTESVKEEILSVQYSQLDPSSKIIGEQMGEIRTDGDVSIRVGPSPRLFSETANSGYRLIAIPVFPMCAKSATSTCTFLSSDISLKTKDGVTIVKNVKADSLYTPYIYEKIGEIDTKYNIPPNTQSGGYMGFHIPTHLLQENKPAEFLMTYKNSDPLTLTLTFSYK